MNGNNIYSADITQYLFTVHIYSADTTQYLFTVHIYKHNTKKRVTTQIELRVIDLSEEFHPG